MKSTSVWFWILAVLVSVGFGYAFTYGFGPSDGFPLNMIKRGPGDCYTNDIGEFVCDDPRYRDDSVALINFGILSAGLLLIAGVVRFAILRSQQHPKLVNR